MVARTPMKQKLAKSHEKRMVRHRKVPNLTKNWRLQANKGSEACSISQTRAASQCLGAAYSANARLATCWRATTDA